MKEPAATGISDHWKVKTWSLVALGGALGWWALLIRMDVAPGIGLWWDILIRLIAVVCFLISNAAMGRDLDLVIEKWISRNGYKAAHALRGDKDMAGRWILAPAFIWWIPTMLAFVDMLCGRLVF